MQLLTFTLTGMDYGISLENVESTVEIPLVCQADSMECT